MATGSAKVAIAKQCGCMTLCFTTASLSDGNTGPNYYHNSRTTCNIFDLDLAWCNL